MDEYQEILKEYIRPYDERIKKLEESEREKNIEISLLKAAADQMKVMIENLREKIKNLNVVPEKEGRGKTANRSPSKGAKAAQTKLKK